MDCNIVGPDGIEPHDYPLIGRIRFNTGDPQGLSDSTLINSRHRQIGFNHRPNCRLIKAYRLIDHNASRVNDVIEGNRAINVVERPNCARVAQEQLTIHAGIDLDHRVHVLPKIDAHRLVAERSVILPHLFYAR